MKAAHSRKQTQCNDKCPVHIRMSDRYRSCAMWKSQPGKMPSVITLATRLQGGSITFFPRSSNISNNNVLSRWCDPSLFRFSVCFQHHPCKTHGPSPNHLSLSLCLSLKRSLISLQQPRPLTLRGPWLCESLWSNPSVSQPVKNSHNAAAPTVITQCSGGTSVTSLSLAKTLQQWSFQGRM